LFNRDNVNAQILNPFACEPYLISHVGSATLAMATLDAHDESWFTVVTVTDANGGTITLPTARQGKIVVIDGTAMTSTNACTIAGHNAGIGADTLTAGVKEVAGDTNNVMLCICIVPSTAAAVGKWLCLATA
jgi:hypothetical protein